MRPKTTSRGNALRCLLHGTLLIVGFFLPTTVSAQPHDTERALALPFVERFAQTHTAPDANRWMPDGGAVVNKDFAPLPPSFGFATLDASLANGRLYPHANVNTFSGDTLTSRLIRLDSSFTGTHRKLRASDSVVMSFYYAPSGYRHANGVAVGDAPEWNDKLLLDFRDSNLNWHTVWQTHGITPDSLLLTTGHYWQYVSISITEEQYFSPHFQFRFRNYCSLDDNPKEGMVANCDQWNIDNIHLDIKQTPTHELPSAIAFTGQAPSLLKQYYAMPSSQYRYDDQVVSTELSINNLSDSNYQARYSCAIELEGTLLTHYYADSNYQIAHSEPLAGSYATTQISPSLQLDLPIEGCGRTFDITHIIERLHGETPTTDADTLHYQQVMTDYFAYDDGFPESGYGITTPDESQTIAVSYVLNRKDTLFALSLWFNSTRNDENLGIKFNIAVWDNLNGKPDRLLYLDPQQRTTTDTAVARFARFALTSPCPLPADTIYIGLIQEGNAYINIAADYSGGMGGNIWYKANNQWIKSSMPVALMMRPHVSKCAKLSVAQAEDYRLTIAPNPANSYITISTEPLVEQPLIVEIYNFFGQLVLKSYTKQPIDVSNLPQGMYAARVLHADRSFTQKFVISR